MRPRNAILRVVPGRVSIVAAALAVLMLAGCAVSPDGDAAHPIEGEGSLGLGESDGIVTDADPDTARDADPWPLDGSAGESADGDAGVSAGLEPRRASETISFVIDDSALGPGVTWRAKLVEANCIAGASDFPEPGSTELTQHLVGLVEGNCWFAEGWASWDAVATLPDGRTASTTFGVFWGEGRSGTTFFCEGFGALTCRAYESPDGPEHSLRPRLNPLPTSPGMVYCAEQGNLCVNTSSNAARVQYQGDEWKIRTVAAGDSIPCTPQAFGVYFPSSRKGKCLRVIE